MTERMASYDVIIPRVLMQVQPCPQFVVLDAVQQVAVDFFTRTEVWTDTMAETLFRGSRVVELTAFMRSGPDRESQCCFMPRMRTPTTPFTRTARFVRRGRRRRFLKRCLKNGAIRWCSALSPKSNP